MKMSKSYVQAYFAVWISIEAFHFIPYSNIVHGLHSYTIRGCIIYLVIYRMFSLGASLLN